MANRVVYYNGEFVPESEARVSVFDSALMFGDMVFDMTRSFIAQAKTYLKEMGDDAYSGTTTYRFGKK